MSDKQEIINLRITDSDDDIAKAIALIMQSQGVTRAEASRILMRLGITHQREESIEKKIDRILGIVEEMKQ
jgi:hypothetical protein